MDRVNLVNANKLYPSEISGGMKKRVAIARAIALKPKYLFFDEPNSGLDPQTSIVIDELIAEITKEINATTIINTHDMNSVFEMGEKIIFIHKGEKAWEGNSSQIAKSQNKELIDFIFASNLLKRVQGTF
jgi:phospholipid/cholesterol/gamma-HCH transport system ATP-binding protein